MNFFSRLSLGWEITLNSFKVIKENKQLLLFPVFSGLAMLAVLSTFVIGVFSATSFDDEFLLQLPDYIVYGSIALFYFVCYFIILFFNVALVHCAKMYFHGEVPTVRAGIYFSLSRWKAILMWALCAGTVGALLRIIQENTGWVGRVISGLIGVVWSIATFFVVPIIAYEESDPFQAVKRSSQLMKEKWGESIGSAFSFGFVKIVAMILLFVVAGCLMMIHPILGFVVGGVGLLAGITILSAAEMIFISAIYHHVHGDPVEQFQEGLVNRLFEGK
jgi:hypothetical protein